ncbi:MAG: lysophospholipid acyltransferase family protein [Aquincola tertiaricarbonis]|uniref:lysophospholipid acyltransferase family protein n=1 Tax=Aquincola TaxID=391952 RepID=UPI000614DA52|nr:MULTISPECIES: lipid A biosynthesis acyltransferase [Aquincola]MCR5866502.1 lipid A biosynthesis acyltransferase [Aquincola sp. J276]
MSHLSARLTLALLWLLHLLPLGLQAFIGAQTGRLLHALAGSRRRIARRNVALCFPEKSAAEQDALVREHFRWLGRSLLERGLLWWASPQRLRRLIHVEGDVKLAETAGRPVMWLVPHFMGLDVAGSATQLFQSRLVGSIYQAQSNAVFDAAMRRGRVRFGQGDIFSRKEGLLPLMRAIRQRGFMFFNLPDMDFGRREAAFVPFFGVPAATLLAPSKLARALDMVVQPVVAEMLPGGQGYRVRFLPPWTDFPTDDPVADVARMNRWIEQEVRRNPAQYLWVHKRFKTRPEGEPKLYR